MESSKPDSAGTRLCALRYWMHSRLVFSIKRICLASLMVYDWVCPPDHQSRVLMKPAKSFVVEIKRNGRRQVVRDREPLWNPKQLKSATDEVDESQKASEIDPGLTQEK